MAVVLGEAITGAVPQLTNKWGVEPVLFRDGDRQHAAELLGLKAINTLLNDIRIPEGMFQVMVNGRAERPRLYSVAVQLDQHVVFRALDPAKVFEAMRKGASLLLAGINEYWPVVRDLCADVTEQCGLGCSAFAFISPTRARGFVPHIDGTDQLVVQCEGSKDWTVYEVRQDIGLRGHKIDPGLLGRPIFEGTLSVGDMLYVPVGAPHVAFASKELSAHLTLMLEPITLAESIKAAVEALIMDDPRLGKTLPPLHQIDMRKQFDLIADAAIEIGRRLPERSRECLASAIRTTEGHLGT